MMNCSPVRLSNVFNVIQGLTGSCGMGLCTQESLTKLPRSPWDPSVVLDSGSALRYLERLVRSLVCLP